MNNIILYFIGLFETLFSYVNPIWHTDKDMQMIFVIVVSVCIAIVLFSIFWIVKTAVSAVYTFLRGA